MKIKKILLGSLLVIVLLVVIAVVAVVMSLDSIVKRGVETFGPQITKVSVKVDAVDIGLLAATCKIKGLEVGNPEGYKAPQSISAGLIGVGVSPDTVFKDKVVIHFIRLESPEITLEGGLMKNNLTKLLDNLSGTNSAPPATTPKENTPAKKLQVDDLLITGAKVHLIDEGVTVPVPEIHLTALGTGPDGITPQDLAKQVLNELINGTLKAVAGSATNLGKGAEKTAEGALDKATKGIGNLFKSKDQ